MTPGDQSLCGLEESPVAVKVDTKKTLVYLTLAFVIVSIYNDPDNSANSIGAFLGDAGHFFTVLLDKSVDFLGGLTDSNG
jgi:hypothetical protein